MIVKCECGVEFDRPPHSKAVRCRPCQKKRDRECQKRYVKKRVRFCEGEYIPAESDYDMTLEEISAIDGASKARIHQIIKGAYAKFKKKAPEMREWIE